MAKRKRKKKGTGDVGTENELMKLKMMAEFGGNFVGSEDIPPEIENEFLKQIMTFHKQHEKSKITTVYQFIGEPEYNHVSDMTDKELDKELKRILNIMAKNGVSLSVLADTPRREVYRFITEELFKHEIEDVKMKGWVNQFIYEEFHPNAEYDVKSAVIYCLQSIFNKGSAFFEEHFSEEMKNGIGLSMDTEELKEKILGFWEQHYRIKLGRCEFVKLDLDNDTHTAQAVCNVAYKIQTAKGKKFKTENTIAEVALERSKYMESWWEVKQIVCDVVA